MDDGLPRRIPIEEPIHLERPIVRDQAEGALPRLSDEVSGDARHDDDAQP